jgi:hypothetical protein
MYVSLREQLDMLFPNDENRVRALLQQYWELVRHNPHWRIGGFLVVIKAAMNGGMG